MKPVRFGIFFWIAMMVMAQYGCLSTGTQKQVEKLIEEKDYHGAVDTYQALIDSKPGTPKARQAQLGIAGLYIEALNSPEQGVQVYRDLIAAAPNSEEAVEAHWRVGLYYFKSADYHSAQQSFDTIVNQFPSLEKSHNAQLMLAKSYEESKNYKKAVEIYDNVAHRHPEGKRAAQALVNRAKIQRKYLKDEIQAKRTYQTLVKRYGKVKGTEEAIAEAKQELRLMGASIPQPDDPLASPHDRALERQRKRRERDRPRDSFERNLETDDSDSGFGVSAQEIMRHFRGGGQTGPSGGIQTDEEGTYYDAMLMIANSIFQSENYRDSGALYYRSIELAKQDEARIDPYDHLRLSICYRKLGLHQRAREVLKTAVRKDRQVLEAVITTGTNQYADGNYEKAIETYNSVVGLNRSKDPELYWKLGLVYKKMGDPHMAVESFERAVVAKADYTDALQSLAEVLYYQLKDEARAGVFQDLVDAKGETYASQKELGDLHYKYGSYARAKSKYEIAARLAQLEKKDTTSNVKKRVLDSQIVHTSVHAAMAAYKNQMEDQAQALIDALAAEYPEHPLIPYGRGQLALLKGDADTA
ncbi:MAG: tetratricopeptide repeat protein, partial [Candidatus Poribacteria bacterium]|nr:tetratricopeptide repeat protein [Candidatus Poribacteria bacterium]